MKPDFMIIGAAKCGTTSLYDDLALHPDLLLPADKEPGVLNKASSPEHALLLWGRHFGHDQSQRLLGEASTSYTMRHRYQDLPVAAKKSVGDELKLIYIMRDPIDRIKSQLAHDFTTGVLNHNDFNLAVQTDSGYLLGSDYTFQLNPWMQLFGQDRILPLVFEEYVADRDATVRKIVTWLELDPSLLKPRSDISNARGSQRLPRTFLLRKFTKSEFYKYKVRSRMPREMHAFMKRMFTTNRKPPTIDLTDAVVEELRYKLRHLNDDLLLMGVDTTMWRTFRGL